MNDEMDASAHESFAEWDASYVLGALSPSDRRAYERHLTGCAICRDAVADLAGMPGLLGVLSREEAEELVDDSVVEVPSASLESSLAELAGSVRRSRLRRRGFAAAAAVVLLAGGGALGGALVGRDGAGEPAAAPSASASAPASEAPGENVRTVDLQPVGSVDLWAQLVVTPTDWGTRLRWSCHYPPKPGESPPAEAPRGPVTYDLVLVGRDGSRTVAGSWTWSGGETLGLDASSAVPINDVERVEITLVGEKKAIAAASLT